ncbi:MAG TPA: PEFG-CTERM sorting domain-containing protein [Nitrosopumilaceae archaeon]|nr:PEFG-CTERM sorting domain-containing protein [Nitrosopumilaceae archaeon]
MNGIRKTVLCSVLILILIFPASTTLFPVKQVSAQLQNTIPVAGTNFGISYMITNGTVKYATIDAQSTSLVISINTTNDGIVTLQIPRSLVDAKTSAGQDDVFIILAGGTQVKPQSESGNSGYRTLIIPFSQGDNAIEIIGTQIVPEFGALTALILAISLTSIVVISGKTKLRFIR